MLLVERTNLWGKLRLIDVHGHQLTSIYALALATEPIGVDGYLALHGSNALSKTGEIG
jgi:hypothetical protein